MFSAAEAVGIGFDRKHMYALMRETYESKKGRNAKRKRDRIVITNLEDQSLVGEFKTMSGTEKNVAEGVLAKIKEKKMNAKKK